MKWVTIKGTHINTNQIQTFFWQLGQLSICIVGAIRTLTWDDPDRELYLTLCRQQGVRPDEEGSHE